MIHFVNHPPYTWVFAWLRYIIHFLDLVSKDKWVATTQLIRVFDLNHAKLVFLSAMIRIKPITIEEDYLSLLFPAKLYSILFLMIL
jgi:hypothetical protein